MCKEAWFKVSELRSKVGVITDIYLDYIELQDIDTKEYYIVHKSKVKIIDYEKDNVN